tara:strand:- start:192 stop:422 length:231 start_codon:yes stop_codon:yes gene_type:complete
MTTGNWTKEEDHGYRRGWDQGVAALAYALGLKDEVLQRLAWKQRCKAFRNYRLEEAPAFATDDEKDELRRAFGIGD